MLTQCNRSLLERFWSKVHKTDSCWLWTAAKTKTGYGDFGIKGQHRRAHRFAWELTNGSIPPGMLVCHNCPAGDNRLCVRPSHLFLGTHTVNMQDASRKGRLATADRHGTQIHPERVARGEARSDAKLTEDAVRQIRHRAASGESRKTLATEFSISLSVLNSVARGAAWRHVH